jgi:Do/DeqQ family serine protease
MPRLAALVLALVPLLSSAETGRLPVEGGQPVVSLAPMLKKVTPAVVNISTRGTVTERSPRSPLLEDPFFRRFFDVPEQGPRQRQFQSAGSGVVVDAKQGLVLTNAHVIEHATEITITTLDGHDYKGEVVGADPASDIAVVRVKNAKLVDIALGDSSKSEVGDFVVAIGNPFGLQHTVTFGIVSALGRTGINPDGYEDFIQTDASINPGNSGGALVNLHGELIGINSAILSGGGGNIGIGFAIPSNMAKGVMEQLITFGSVKRGILGVNVVTLTPEYADNLGVKDAQGALVSQVLQGSAADGAGIKAGDVITSVNGQSVKSGAELRNRIGLLRIGESVDIGYLHDGKPVHASATVQARSDVEESAQDLHRALEGAELNDAQGGGVNVRSIAPGSPASQLGLLPNDLIVQVNRSHVQTLKDLRAAMKDVSSALLSVRRGGALILIPLR